GEALLVRVTGREPVAVVDARVVAVAAARGLRLREQHGAGGGGGAGRPARDPDVDAPMAALPRPRRAERRGARPPHGPDEAGGADLAAAGAPRQGGSGWNARRTRGRRLGGGDLGGDLPLDGGDVALQPLG